MKQHQHKLILLLFALSAAAGLIYQIAWVRQTSLIFGVSIYAYSTVLAAFMGGMALGSYFLRRLSQRHSPLLVYLWLQVGVALFGLLSPFLLAWLMPLYKQIAQGVIVESTGSFALIGLRGFFSLLILIPSTLLMGGTLPALAHAVAQQKGRVGADVGNLYAADTLGAALGCGLSGLWLLRIAGTQRTILIAVLLNLFCAAAAYWLWRKSQSATENKPNVEIAPSTPKRRQSIPHAQSLGSTQDKPATRQQFAAHLRMRTKQFAFRLPPSVLIPTLYLLSGFAAIGYEIVWARILSIFTLDAVYSFSIMLTTFLVGLTLGGWIGARWVQRRKLTLLHFGLLEFAVALAALATLYIFYAMPNFTLEDLFGTYSVVTGVAFEFVLGFLALIVPTLLLGMLFPVVVSLATDEQVEGVSERIGLVSVLNTTGGVLGSLLVGFGLIPAVGLKGALLVLVALNLGIGIIACLAHSDKSRDKNGDKNGLRIVAPTLATILIGVLALLAPPGYYLGFRSDPGENMIYYGEGAETTVAVFEVPEQNFKVSFVNGRIEVPTDPISMNAFRLLGHLGPILRPNAENALMLSFGNGIASGSLATHRIPTIDAVDLSAEQFEAADKYFQENHNVLHSAALHTHVEDGRNFLLQTATRYAIITTDATHPSNASSWALFTHEFYQSVAEHLTPDGVFVQWLPFHSLLEGDFQKILRTFQAVFPHATLWYTTGTHTLLVATPKRLTPEQFSVQLQQAFSNPYLSEELESPQAVQAFWSLDEDAMRNYTGTGALVLDDNAFFLPDNSETEQIMQALKK